MMKNTKKKIKLNLLDTNFKSFRDMKQVLDTNEKCIMYLEELIWEGVPVSPFDINSKVYKCKNHRYKCKNTGKYFTVLTGTIFENTKLPLTLWFELIYLDISHRDGIPSTTAADILGITQKTAFHMLQKIRHAMKSENFQKLSGIVEADEFYAGGLLKNMHYDKKKIAKEKGSYQNKIPMHGIVERNGNAVITVLQSTEASAIGIRIQKYLSPGSVLYTDENKSYDKIDNYYKHASVVHSKCNYVSDNVYTNSIESVWATLARTFKTYIHFSKKHIQNYANEVVFRYNTRKMKCIDSCIWFLQNIVNTKITQKEIALGIYQ